MDSALLNANLTNPTLLFFLLGILARLVKSDLEIPPNSAKFISLYLLFAIGFKGGQELAHSTIDGTIIASLVFGLVIAAAIPFYVFFLLKNKLGVQNAGAIAAAYGSVSAVTFVAATGFLETRELTFGGHMVAIMAMMESPAIIVGMVLLMRYDPDGEHPSLGHVLRHSLTNGSVLLLLGSLAIGLVADARQAQGIKPFTTDIFKGFLAIFLLEMGMVTAAGFGAFRRYGLPASVTAVLLPLINGCAVAWCSGFITPEVGDRFMFAVLAASASYIAVPAAMRLAAPKADPGLYIPMALGITFPFNLMLGMPLYFTIVSS
ncbi:MAG: sodium-dependent bicarbonate transport family permease [Flavobacteriales bacterium]|nr:sodium-dependent bicarbonate transport family permease [Flavobacteriales bacterium]